MQSSLLVAMDSEAQPLRRVVGTNVATIVAAAGFHGWSQLLPALVARLQSDHPAALDGALDALFKVPLLLPLLVQPAESMSLLCLIVTEGLSLELVSTSFTSLLTGCGCCIRLRRWDN